MLALANSRSKAGPQARKHPRQRRSRDTVAVILAAATRIFATRGYERTTTNHIADKAGVSIGSLYQYFPHKAAIASALEDQHLDEVSPALIGLAARMRAKRVTIATWVRAFVEAILAANDEPQHRALYGVVPRTPATQARAEALVDAIATHLAPLVAGSTTAPSDRPRTNASPTVREMTRAKLGIVAAITLVHELALFASPEERPVVLREIERMVAGYLGA
jgi:AcrR family transcriptional regulator